MPVFHFLSLPRKHTPAQTTNVHTPTHKHTLRLRLPLMTKQSSIYSRVPGRVGRASALCWKYMCRVGVTGGPCAQAQSCNVFLRSQLHEPGRLTYAKASSLRRSDSVSIRRFVMDEPICTPVTPRELKITHRLPSFVCSESGREGENKISTPFFISSVIDSFHIRPTGPNPKVNHTWVRF